MDENTIKLRTYYDTPLYCPFCGAHTQKIENGEINVEAGCNHLMLVELGEGILYASERVRDHVRTKGYTIEDDGGLMFLRKMEIHDEDDDFESWAIKLIPEFTDLVVFEQIVGSPSLESTFTVFAFNDEDYAAYGESLHSITAS